jgi:hypothetical protein
VNGKVEKRLCGILVMEKSGYTDVIDGGELKIYRRYYETAGQKKFPH